MTSWFNREGLKHFQVNHINLVKMTRIWNSFDGLIRWLYQFWIPKLRIFLTSICYDFFQLANWKENMFWTNKKLVYVSTPQTEKKSWTKLGKTSDEFVRYVEIQDRWQISQMTEKSWSPPFPIVTITNSKFMNFVWIIHILTLSNHYHCKPGVTAFHKPTYGKLVLIY